MNFDVKTLYLKGRPDRMSEQERARIRVCSMGTLNWCGRLCERANDCLLALDAVPRRVGTSKKIRAIARSVWTGFCLPRLRSNNKNGMAE